MLGVAFSVDQDPPGATPPRGAKPGPSAGVHGSITIPFTNLLDHQNKRSLICQEEGPEALAPEHEA